MTQRPVYFGKLMPPTESLLDRIKDLIRPHVADLGEGESVGIRVAMTKDGPKLLIDPKRIEVLLTSRVD